MPDLSRDRLDEVARAHAETRQLVFAYTASADTFFPEVAYIPAPASNGPPLLAVAFSPSHAVLAMDWERKGRPADILTVPRVFPTLSASVGTEVQRLIVPPCFHMDSTTRGAEFANWIKLQRSHARQLFDGLGLAAMQTGLPAWSWT